MQEPLKLLDLEGEILALLAWDMSRVRCSKFDDHRELARSRLAAAREVDEGDAGRQPYYRALEWLPWGVKFSERVASSVKELKMPVSSSSSRGTA